jgi:hypothetical protein
MSQLTDREAAERDLRRIDRLDRADRGPDHTAGDKADRIAEEWGDLIYFCVECDEECRARDQYARCSRYPKEHDETGYMGTGTDYPDYIQTLARRISQL